MTHPVVTFEDEGKTIEAYRVDTHCGVIVLVPKHRVDAGETTVEAEVSLALEQLSC